jgi:asparagine synthase (glutamine-hydrolysing)
MCGIAGVFDSEGISARLVARMLRVLRHRGPDDWGVCSYQSAASTWQEHTPNDLRGRDGTAKADLGLGHQRLSILDLSAAGHQPMGTPDGSLWITYNGEIFNYRELRTQLQERGYTFRSQTDTEVLLAAYQEYGESCLERLRGFFALGIYDAPRRRLFLARDRLGLKPLKYYWDGRRFAFASELKALLELPGLERTVDPAAIDLYLAHRYVPAPYTGIRNIYKLPAGCALTLSLEQPASGPRLSRYWLPQFEPKANLTFTEAQEQTLTLLEEATHLRLMADVPLGVFLSGGIDSSTIIALLRRRYPGEIRTFSVGFTEENYDERPFARMVAERYHTRHTELLVEPKLIEDLHRIVWHFDEPFGDPSAIPSFYLAQAAAPHVTVILNGDGGDELFGGYKRYRIQGRNWWLDYLPAGIRRLAGTLGEMTPVSPDKSRGWGKCGRLLESLQGDALSTYPLRFSGLSARVRQGLYGSMDSWQAAPNGWGAEVIALLAQTQAHPRIEKLMALDQLTYLSEDILVKSDLAGMAHGMEARSPFLDHVLVEWINRLPLHYKFNGGGKRLLREALQDYLPREILQRKKAGFNPPLARWTRTTLKEEMAPYFLSPSSPLQNFNPALRHELYQIHQSGQANLSEPLWLLFVLGLWLEMHQLKIG